MTESTQMIQTQSSTPTVDVVIPVYNGRDYIIQALQSVEKQTISPHRLIIIDDGSTDGTGKLVQSYKCRIPLKYYYQAQRGLSAARNTGILHAHSEFIAFLDADDVWYPSKLEKQLDVMAKTKYQSLGVVYCQYDTIDQLGSTTKSHYMVHIDPTVRGDIFQKILSSNKIVSSGSGVLIRRLCFERTGLFDENLQAFEDWDMWLRLSQNFQFDFTPETLVRIRRHTSNMQHNKSFMFRNSIAFYNKWINTLPENVLVPAPWVFFLVTSIQTRMPKLDFWHVAHSNLSTQSWKRIRKTILLKHKRFILVRLLLLPITIIRNIILLTLSPTQTNYAKL